MTEPLEQDFTLEFRLRKLSPELHKRFTDGVFGLQRILSNYKLIFPEYTDHTELHSMTVINFCARLIGEQIEQMNADEIYSLLMGCYFHDTGMGVTPKDFRLFTAQLGLEDYLEEHPEIEPATLIRAYHNEYSGLFIRKYAPFFEMPSDEHLRAIIQISRGHRKTDLTDESAYPVALTVPGGNTICLPYLTALVRLADEIDVTSARNSALLYDLDAFVDPGQVWYHRQNLAVHALDMTDEAFTLRIDNSDAALTAELEKTAKKMQKTLDTCRAAVNGRTPFEITQREVRVAPI